MSVRIETLGMRSRTPQTAWLVAVAGLLAVLAVLTLLGSIAPDTTVPVRPPAVATTGDSTPGAAIKAVANDPYVLVTPWSPSTLRTGLHATKSSVSEPGFGPNYNMGRTCPKCW